MAHVKSASAQRLDRERSFHDDRFTDDGARDVTAKYYGTAQGAISKYRAAVADLGAGQDVLEYGCGVGLAAWTAAARGARVTGIDLSPVAIETARDEARRRGLAVDLAEMNAEALEFADGSFDLVCGSGILHHLDLSAAYGELSRVLRSDGHAVFYEPLGHNPLINLYRRLTPNLRSEDEHPLTIADLEAIGNWFERVDVEFHVLTALLASPISRFRFGQPLVAILSRIDRFLFRTVPATRSWAWIAVLHLRDPRP